VYKVDTLSFNFLYLDKITYIHILFVFGSLLMASKHPIDLVVLVFLFKVPVTDTFISLGFISNNI